MKKASRVERLVTALLAVVLAVGLMPLPAFAGDLSVATSDLSASPDSLDTQGSSAYPTHISLGYTEMGYAQHNNDQWFSFTTTGGHSAYMVELVSMTDNQTVEWNMYDTYGDYITYDYTRTKTTKKVLLSANSTYKLKVTNYSGAYFTICVTEVPSNPQYQALGNDKNYPCQLTLGKAINSQFDDPDGRQEQWFEFKTTNRHSAYRITLFSRMDNQTVTWNMYDSYGDYVTYDYTRTRTTKNVLLSANSTYRIKVDASYNGESGFPSYQLKVKEIPSNPQYKSRGKNKNKPYSLKLGKNVASQFDDASGRQEQWFKFKTGSGSRPYLITLTSKTSNARVDWNLYDYYGNYVTYDYTSTKTTKTVALQKNKVYFLKVSGSYDGDKGFTSYKIAVNHLSVGTINSFKVKAQGRDLVLKYSKASNATGYQIAYKKTGTKDWSYASSSSNSCTLYWMEANTKYQVKVRASHYLDGNYYYGKWTNTKTVKTKS